MKVFNTLSGEKEEFLPQGSEVKMYVCGVTPYDECHIGHAMSYIIFDVIRRYLKFRGYRVKYVQNVTDIDDKIIDRAAQRGVKASELAQRYTDSFFEDMDALNIERADFYPYATGEIDKIIEVIEGLIDKGHAYPAGGSVYFRVKSSPDYGKLSRRSLESMMSSCSLEMGKEKEHPMDFALWKAAKPGEPYWESPWGQGRPGWHIECSAMSLKYLGDSLDIHGGGQDLIFPHHENEIAQSECFTGTKPFVKYWLHNGMVQFGEEKMSKSLGNLITIKEALEKYGADALRIFVLSSHYRSPLTYSEEALEAAKRGAERLEQAAHSVNKEERPRADLNIQSYKDRFIEVMDDDFNTPQAIATLFDLAREINRASEAGYDVSTAQEVLQQLADTMGLTLRLTEEKSYEAMLYNRFLKLYEYPSSDKLLEIIKSSLPELEKKEAIYKAILGFLRNQLAHATYLSLDTPETNTHLYTQTLNSLRARGLSKDVQTNLEEIKTNLKTLSDSAAVNTSSYISIRDQLRRTEQWQLADEIRSKLGELNITLEDTPEGTIPRYKR